MIFAWNTNIRKDKVKYCLPSLKTASLKLLSIQISAKSGIEVATRNKKITQEYQMDNSWAMASAAGTEEQ